MTKLRECPFCNDIAQAYSCGGVSWRVACCNSECQARGPTGVGRKTAIRLWNTRPGERAAAEAMRDLLAACKGLIQWMLNEDALRRLGFNPERAMKDYHFAKEVIAKVDGR